MIILNQNRDEYVYFFRLLVSQERESKMSLERTLAAIDKVTINNINITIINSIVFFAQLS